MSTFVQVHQCQHLSKFTNVNICPSSPMSTFVQVHQCQHLSHPTRINFFPPRKYEYLTHQHQHLPRPANVDTSHQMLLFTAGDVFPFMSIRVKWVQLVLFVTTRRVMCGWCGEDVSKCATSNVHYSVPGRLVSAYATIDFPVGLSCLTRQGQWPDSCLTESGQCVRSKQTFPTPTAWLIQTPHDVHHSTKAQWKHHTANTVSQTPRG